MGARATLNSIYVNLSLVLAAVVGYVTGSWIVFVVSLIVLVAVNVHAGRIRPRGNRRSH
jgi:hypothetical protein